jgi:methylmalonyl-CoA mutase
LTQAASAAAATASQKSENLLHLSVEAARARCTVGEISGALEVAFSRFEPKSSVVSGAYSKAYSTSSSSHAEIKATIARAQAFAQKHGRRPRILVAKLGQDGHDRGAKVIASSFADLGFDVDVGPLFQVPKAKGEEQD